MPEGRKLQPVLVCAVLSDKAIAVVKVAQAHTTRNIKLMEMAVVAEKVGDINGDGSASLSVIKGKPG